MPIDPFLWPPETVKMVLADKARRLATFFAWQYCGKVTDSCQLLSVLVSSIFCLPPWVWTSIFEHLTIICKHATQSRMLKPRVKLCRKPRLWHAGGQGEQAWEKSYIQCSVVHWKHEVGKHQKVILPWLSQKNSAYLNRGLLWVAVTVLDTSQVLWWGRGAGRGSAQVLGLRSK